MGITIGNITPRNRVFLAPMSGISDAPMRALADEFGAGLVISEMVASHDLVRRREEGLRRVKRAEGASPFVVQLAGREARWMAEGARIACDLGADIVDINMGCPAKQVTGGLSGSALMREPDHALSLIEAVVAASRAPVTLKMRLGWDDNERNAPDLAARAESAGVQMVTVHGRTRCQFYEGAADWTFIARVKQAVRIPVVANGDLTELGDADEMLRLSGADAVMIGRGANGRPWFPGAVARHLDGPEAAPPPPQSCEIPDLVKRHYQAMLDHYGRELGRRCARKHLGWYVEEALGARGQSNDPLVKHWRGQLCREEEPARVVGLIDALFDAAQAREAA